MKPRILVIDSVNPKRILGCWADRPYIPTPDDPRAPLFYQVMLEPLCGWPDRYPTVAHECRTVRFEIKWLPDINDPWLRRGALSTDATLFDLMQCKPFRLPGETDQQAWHRRHRP